LLIRERMSEIDILPAPVLLFFAIGLLSIK
jgi:hypothetical protein